MVKIKGNVTRIELGSIELTNDDLEKVISENFTPKELTILAQGLWLKSKGLEQDSILMLKAGKTDEYVWKSYEDNGSHYSGYFEVKRDVKPQDLNIFNAFETLFDKLSD